MFLHLDVYSFLPNIKACAELNSLREAQRLLSQEKDQLIKENQDLEAKLVENERSKEESSEYIEVLQTKIKEERKARVAASFEMNQNIALERENLVRQLEKLR